MFPSDSRIAGANFTSATMCSSGRAWTDRGTISLSSPKRCSALGTPLCGACFDYVGAVLFNAHAGKLWHRFVDDVRRVMLPNSAPAIAESLRLVLGWAWTYVIVAELIGASSGIGHMITDSQALLNTGQIIFGIIVIGIIGLISDFLFKWANHALYPWSLE